MNLGKKILQKEFILLFLLVSVSFFLRIFQLEDRMYWYGDMGRDALIADQIVNHNVFPLVGHTASGFTPVFYYPPFYYYLLAIFLTLTQNPVILTGIFAFFHSLLTLLIYKISKSATDSSVGLLVAFFYSVSSRMIQIGSSVWPVYVMPMFFFLGLWLINRRRLLGYAFLIFSTTIHYSAAPLVFLLIAKELYELFRQHQWKQALLFTIFLSAACLACYYPLASALGFHGVFSSANVRLEHATFWKFVYHIRTSWEALFSSRITSTVSLYALTVGAGTLYISQGLVGLRKFLPTLIAIIVFCFGLSLKPGGVIPFWNYTILFPLFIFIMAVMCAGLLQSHNITAKLIGIFCTMLFSFTLIDGFSSNTHKGRDFFLGQSVSEIIYHDAKTRGYFPNIYVAADESYSKNQFERYRLWYFFEKIHKGFVVYDSSSYGLTQSLQGNWPYYLACENASIFDVECVDSFLAAFPNYTESFQIDINNLDVKIHVFLPSNATFR